MKVPTQFVRKRLQKPPILFSANPERNLSVTEEAQSCDCRADPTDWTGAEKCVGALIDVTIAFTLLTTLAAVNPVGASLGGTFKFSFINCFNTTRFSSKGVSGLKTPSETL